MNPSPAGLVRSTFRRAAAFVRCCPHPRSLLVCLGLAAASAQAAVPLVPGAYGYGFDRNVNPAAFGTGAVVVVVDSLLDSGPGTLRAALTNPTNERRIIIFKASGVIDLASDLSVNTPNMTIAGQTAPNPGISLQGGTLKVSADNVLVQHLRIRPGDRWAGSSTHNRDAGNVNKVLNSVIRNVVFDHVTFMWSLDELVDSYWDYDNIAFHKCIFAEPMNKSIHLDEDVLFNDVPATAESMDSTLTVGSVTQSAATSSHAVGGSYRVVNTTGVGQWIEYKLKLQSSTSTRLYNYILIAGITGTNRGTFRVDVYPPYSDPLNPPTPLQTETFNQNAAEALENHIPRTKPVFTIPANVDHLKVRLTCTGTTSGGYNLGVDQISITQAHGFGPLFSTGRTGAGKLSVIGSVFSNLAARGPWVNSHKFVVANNVHYNRSQLFAMVGHSSWPNETIRGAFIYNNFIEGPSWGGGNSPIYRQAPLHSSSQIYVLSTPADYNPGQTPVLPILDPNITNASSDPTLPYSDGMDGFVPQTAAVALTNVLSFAGARPANRDSIETRIISEINTSKDIAARASRLGSVKDTVAQAGGFSTTVGPTATWTYPNNPNTASGSYTNIEVWLHGFAAAVETGVPPPPANLTATATTFNTINLTWTDYASNESGFKIERKKTSGGSYTQIGTAAANATTFADTAAGAGTQYTYRVRAYNGTGDSTFTPEASATTTELTSGRVAHWKLNASSGTSVVDETGNNNGTSTGGPTWIAAKIGNGLNFDGVDDLVNAGSSSTTDALPAITVSAWIKADTMGEGSTGRIVHKGDGGSSTAGWRLLLIGTNAISFAVDYSPTDLVRSSANNVVPFNTWKHVLATWTGTALATDVKIYIDGQEVSSYQTSTNGNSARNADAAMNLFLGNDSNGDRSFDGVLDDVRIYNRVLTTAEILSVFRAGQ